MNLSVDDDFELFCKNKALQGANRRELKSLYELTTKVTLEPGDILIREGDKGDRFFFILKGILEVGKHHKIDSDIYTIHTLGPGDITGENSFIDQQARSATVWAKTKVTVRALSFEAIERFSNQSFNSSKCVVILTRNVTKNLRITNRKIVETISNEIRENTIRVRMGNFLIYVLTVLCFFISAIEPLRRLVRIVPNSSYVSIPLIFLLGLSLLGLIKRSKISWNEFGISLKNWKQAVFDGVVFSIPIILLGIITKWLFIQFIPEYVGHPIFEPFAGILNYESHTFVNWFIFAIIYWIFAVPAQELIARGALQSMLEHFLLGKHPIFYSILLSNLMFGTIHLFFSVTMALFVFIGGIYIGWIYSRTHNLISSWIAHAFIGTIFLMAAGPAIS